MGGSVITPEDVLESLMNDGTIDAIRLKIINQLKGNVSAQIFDFTCHLNSVDGSYFQYFCLLALGFISWHSIRLLCML